MIYQDDLFCTYLRWNFGVFGFDTFQLPKGLTSTNSILTLSLGLVMFTLGIIGEYVGRIYFEVKNRPNYVINEIIL